MRENMKVNSYFVGAPQIYPAVEHIRFMELLAFTLILQTNSKIPVYVAIAKGHIKRNSVCILVTFLFSTYFFKLCWFFMQKIQVI